LIQSSITESLSELGEKESKGERVGKVGIREFEPVVDRHVGNADGERGERRDDEMITIKWIKQSVEAA
jgi:hypothetical protein